MSVVIGSMYTSEFSLSPDAAVAGAAATLLQNSAESSSRPVPVNGVNSSSQLSSSKSWRSS